MFVRKKFFTLFISNMFVFSLCSCNKNNPNSYKDFINKLYSETISSNYEIIMGFSDYSDNKYSIFVNSNNELGLRSLSDSCAAVIFLPKTENVPMYYEGVYIWNLYSQSAASFNVSNSLNSDSYFSFSTYSGTNGIVDESLANAAIKATIYYFINYCYNNYNFWINSIGMFPNM